MLRSTFYISVNLPTYPHTDQPIPKTRALRALVGVGLSMDPVVGFQGNEQHLIRLKFIQEITSLGTEKL